jgi:MFS transporter, MHS family, proline/betaine transporter
MMNAGTISKAGSSASLVTPSMLRRAVVSCALGQVFENFDFVLYGFMAATLARSFFPAGHPLVALLSTFATFAMGFLMRPIGAFVLGHFGDKYGRVRALVLTITMMALSTGVIGLIPTYSSIGIFAPCILIICRMFQGFAAGGEWGGAAVFLVEYAPIKQRGFISSFQQAGTGLGVLLASLPTAILATVLTPQEFLHWGWRLPFLFGFVLGPIGHYLRTHVAETPSFKRQQAAHAEPSAPIREAFTTQRRALSAVFGMSILSICLNVVFLIFLPAFAVHQLHLPASAAFFSTTIAGVIYVIGPPLSGTLSDRIGRKPILFAQGLSAIILSYPLFLLVNSWKSVTALILTEAIAGVIIALGAGVGAAIRAEAFPTRVRYTGLSVSYGLSIAIFGGFGPLIATGLIGVTGNPLAPAYYVIAGAISTLVAICFMREGYGKPLLD